jgi:hypothetical protein
MRSTLRQQTPACCGPMLSLLLPLLLPLHGCPAPEFTFPFDYTGEPGTSVPVTFYSDVPQVEVVVDSGETYDFLLDTGAPATILDVTAYDIAPGIYPASTVEALGITVLDLDCAVLYLFGGSLDVGGILGGDILRHFALTLDYRGAWATLFVDLAGDLPPGGDNFGPTTTRSFELRGGGLLGTPSGDSLRVPPTRVVLALDIEGHDVLAVLDTGASSVVLDESLYELLLDERPERPVLKGFQVLTVDIAQDVEITRLASVRLADDWGSSDADQTSVPALVVLGSTALDSLSAETGRPVQALLGGAFLRYYQLTIDYPARRVTLQPYLETDHVYPDEYVSVGFTWDQLSTGNVVVERVIPDSDADQQGVAEGDRILRAGIYDILLTGEGGVSSAVSSRDVGETVPFTLERNDATAIYDILVEDLLPAFQ